ncbi:MAG: sugar kinase [Burkholderiales bacterium]|jgi:2-dehydro-3-deoxygluconokinase
MSTIKTGVNRQAVPPKRFDIVAFGEPMYEFSQVPGKQREYLQGFGGDTMNCAIAAARQGARVAYLCRLGDDEFGRQMLQLWGQEGVDASAVKIDSNAHTAVYFIAHGPSGHTFSYMRKNSAASRFAVADLPQKMLKNTRFFFSSGITQAISETACEAVFAAIDMARSAGARIVFDANLRPSLWPVERAREIVGKTVALSDYFLLSLEDAEMLCGTTDPEAVLDWCARGGAHVAVIKLGAEGAMYRHAGLTRKVAGFPVKAVDATGAGDCFGGSLMARLCLGDEIDAAVTYACAAAGLACTGYGAVDPLPRPDQVFELMGTGYGRSVASGKP